MGWISFGYKQTCFSFRDLGVPVTRSPLPVFQGVRQNENWNGNAWGLFLSWLFLRSSAPKRAEVSRKKMKFQEVLPPEKVWRERKCCLQNN